MKIPDRDLVLKSAALARAAPSQWSDFLAAMKGVTDETLNDVLKSPTEMLQVNQGRARMIASLLETLATCKQDADKYKK